MCGRIPKQKKIKMGGGVKHQKINLDATAFSNLMRKYSNYTFKNNYKKLKIWYSSPNPTMILWQRRIFVQLCLKKAAIDTHWLGYTRERLRPFMEIRQKLINSKLSGDQHTWRVLEYSLGWARVKHWRGCGRWTFCARAKDLAFFSWSLSSPYPFTEKREAWFGFRLEMLPRETSSDPVGVPNVQFEDVTEDNARQTDWENEHVW